MSEIKKNSMPEVYDDGAEFEEDTAPTTQEEILQNEEELLRGLIEAGRGKDDANAYRKIEIKRGGKLMFTFRVRPLSEEETSDCRDRATKFAPRRKGQPKKALDTNWAKFRSWLIYAATVDEDRAKLWDNKRAQAAFNVLQGVDMIDEVLLAGEKERVIEVVDEISGYGDEMEETAKN